MHLHPGMHGHKYMVYIAGLHSGGLYLTPGRVNTTPDPTIKWVTVRPKDGGSVKVHDLDRSEVVALLKHVNDTTPAESPVRVAVNGTPVVDGSGAALFGEGRSFRTQAALREFRETFEATVETDEFSLTITIESSVMGCSLSSTRRPSKKHKTAVSSSCPCPPSAIAGPLILSVKTWNVVVAVTRADDRSSV